MKIIILCFLAPMALFLSACKKNTATNPQPYLSSVTVVNATTGLGAIYFNPYSTKLIYAQKADSILYKGTLEYGIQSGVTSLKVVPARDTLNQLFNVSFTLQPSTAYSLYVTGNQLNNQTIFNAETAFPRYVDSAVAIRVINISLNSPPVNVTLRATPTVNEFANLAYKQQSAFNKYMLNSAVANTGLTFDIRNTLDNSILASYSLQQFSSPSLQSTMFKAITLVINGRYGASVSSPDAYNVFAIKNY